MDLPPGLPPRWAQTHLELFASKVIPAFRYYTGGQALHAASGKSFNQLEAEAEERDAK
jgi:hypothetical protein